MHLRRHTGEREARGGHKACHAGSPAVVSAAEHPRAGEALFQLSRQPPSSLERQRLWHKGSNARELTAVPRFTKSAKLSGGSVPGTRGGGGPLAASG